MLHEDLKPALQGALPSVLVTCSAGGEPNATTVSQVYWVDGDHVALSFQFFNKTIRNVRENPYACARVMHPGTLDVWVIDLRYERSETTGGLFDEMEMQLMAIASMTGMSDVFKLHAADIYRVEGVRHIGKYVMSWPG